MCKLRTWSKVMAFSPKKSPSSCCKASKAEIARGSTFKERFNRY